MATFSGGQAIYGLQITATPDKTNVNGSQVVGVSQTRESITVANIGYAVRAILAATGNDFVIDLATGVTTGSTSWVAGAAQVEEATAVGTITTAGNATAIVTSAGMAGSPLTVTYAVALNDTPAQWAVKAQAALAANAVIAARFAVGGGSAKVRLTRLPSATISGVPIYLATDSTLNIALADDTSAGITEDATSDEITSGTATSGVMIYDDGEDVDGDAIVMDLQSVLIKCTAGTVSYTATGESGSMTGDGTGYAIRLISGNLAASLSEDYAFNADAGPAEITITALGTST